MTSTTSTRRGLSRRLVGIGTALTLIAVNAGLGLASGSAASAATDWPNSINVTGASLTLGATVHDGLLYTADNGSGKIRTTEPSGATATILTVTDDSTDGNPNNKLDAVAVDSNGNIAFTFDRDGNIYRLQGGSWPKTVTKSYLVANAVFATTEMANDYIYGLAFDNNDRLYYGSGLNSSVHRLPAGGGASVAVIPSLPAAVLGMGFSPTRSLYFATDEGDQPVYTATEAQLNSGAPIGQSDLARTTVSASYQAIAFTGVGLQYFYTAGSAGDYFKSQFGSGYQAGTVSVSGTTQRGQTLTANTSGWPAGSTYTYQWQRNSADIAGATGSTYVLQPADIGTSIRVVVVGSANNLSDTATSPAVGLVTGTYVAGDVSVSGTAQNGQTLTATLSNWPAGSTYAYQWYRNDVAIPSATSSTYTATASDIQKFIKVTVVGSANGESGTTTSSAVGPILSSYVPGTVTVSGTAAAGRTLTSSLQSWPAGSTFTYQWNRDGVAIAAATAATYFVTSADIGKSLTLTVTGSSNGDSGSATSSAVTGGAYSPGAVAISGNTKTGQTLTATVSGWPSGTTYTYQWYRGSSAIVSATGSTYTTTGSDAGANIKVTVVGTTNGESGSTSATVGPIVLTYVPGTVTVSGNPAAGRTLTGSLQNWPSGSTFTYQWYRGNAAIANATNIAYTVTSADVGQSLTLTVTGTASGDSGSASSTAVTGVAYQPGDVTITGTAATGQPLTATLSNWPAGSTFTYAWYRNNVAIPGATAASYTPGTDDVNSTLTVRVTATTNGESGSNTSPATQTVAVTQPLAAPLFSGQTSTTVSQSTSVGTAISYTGLGATGNPTPTYTVTDEDGDGIVLPPGITFANGVLSGTTTKAGEFKVLVTATNSQGSAEEHITLTVAPGAPVGVHALVYPGGIGTSLAPDTVWEVTSNGIISLTDGTVVTQNTFVTAKKGSSITVKYYPVDQYENESGAATTMVVTSSMPTDTVDNDGTGTAVVTFNHASPHVITMQQGSLRNSFLVEVEDPAAVASAGSQLAVTGLNLTAPLWLGLGLLMAGLVVAAVRTLVRRARR